MRLFTCCISVLSFSIWCFLNLIISGLMASPDPEVPDVEFEAKAPDVEFEATDDAKEERKMLMMFSEKYLESRKGRFPETLNTFGFGFNEAGQLRKLDPETREITDEPFKFDVTDDDDYNQRRYEALGVVITRYMYDIMESDFKLRRLDVPLKVEYLKKTFIYGTDDCLYNNDRLLILLQGSGAVRAGQWARSLIINDGLETGSMIPYINTARAQGYSILILNPNESKKLYDGKEYDIPHSKTPSKHFHYVWKTYIKTARARYIAIVAHSYGGVLCIEGAQNFFSDFNQRVYAIAMTDSAHHSLKSHKLSTKVTNYLQRVTRNWAADTTPLDTPIQTPPDEIPAVSAGTSDGSMAPFSCMDSVFSFFFERFQSVTGGKKMC